MFEYILKPLLDNSLKKWSYKENNQYFIGEDDDILNEKMLEFECEWVLM